MLPLSTAPAGKALTISKITGSDEIRRHLAELGLVVDSEVEILKSLDGDLILRLNETRLAISRELGDLVMVD